MIEKQTTIYITEDGKEFTDKQQAIEHEQKLKNVKAFLVRYAPDLTEGRGLQKSGIVWVHARSSHRLFVEHWCYKKFGNRIAFCMGVYGSNAITDCWVISEASEKDLKRYEVIHKIEENFVTKIWEGDTCSKNSSSK